MSEKKDKDEEIPKEDNIQSPLIENKDGNLNNENNNHQPNKREGNPEENHSIHRSNKALESIKSISFVINRKIRWILFFLFIIINLLMNFDHGTIPAATEQLRNYLELTDSELGLFGSLVFIGVIIGSLISMTIINTFNRKYILIICLILCGLSLFAFTSTTNYILLCLDRVIIGIFQAFISIYLPLWCDQFGIETRKALMMALIQVAPPLGVLVGYIVTTVLNMYLTYLPYYGDIEKNKRWLFSFYIQSFIIWGITISLFLFSDKYFKSKARRVPIEVEENLNKNSGNRKLSFFYEGSQNYDDVRENDSSQDYSEKDDNEDNEEKEEKEDNNEQKEELKDIKEKKEKNEKNENIDINKDNEEEGNKNENKKNNNNDNNENNENKLNDKKNEALAFCTKVKLILFEPLFICCVLTMSVLFFIVTCVQYWTSDYMLIALEVEDETKRLYAFSIVCLTSPTCGLLFGGFIVDKIGGYSKKGALIFSLIVAFLSIIPGVPLPLVDSLYLYATCLWLLLFFGASILPTIQGLAIACLPKNVQGSGNSFVIFFYNLVGYLPAPFVYGFLKDEFNDENDPKKGSRVAQRATIWVTFSALLFVGIATIIRFKKGKEYDEKMGRDKTKINEDNIDNENDENDPDAIRPRESSLKVEVNKKKENEKENENEEENENENEKDKNVELKVKENNSEDENKNDD